MLPVADELSRRMGDGNSKVAVAALQGAEALLPLLKGDALERAAPLLLPGLASCLSSTVRPVAEAAGVTLDRFLHSGEPSALVQPLSACIRHGPGSAKVKGALLDRLAALIPEAHSRRPALLGRHVLPLALELVEESRPEMKGPVAALVSRLAACLGPEAVLDAAKGVMMAQGGTAAAAGGGGGGGGSLGSARLSEGGYDKLRRMVGRA
jgi:hypothetical protein